MTILASVNNKTVMPGITPIADVPDTPTIGTATAAGLAASITFTAATTGGTATTFTATSNPGSLTGTASSSPVTVSGLTDATSYTFTVTAENSTGTSPASSASNSITAVSPISGGYDALATVIVPSGGLSSVVFAGIPTGYKHLQLRMFVQGTRADYGIAGARMTFNSDSGSNYAYHQLNGNGSSADAGANTSLSFIRINDGNFGTNQGPGGLTFGASILDILDYANTSKYKTTRALAGVDINGTVLSAGGRVGLFSGLWQSTSAVTSFNITPDSATDFRQYSSFALYGVK